MLQELLNVARFAQCCKIRLEENRQICRSTRSRFSCLKFLFIAFIAHLLSENPSYCTMQALYWKQRSSISLCISYKWCIMVGACIDAILFHSFLMNAFWLWKERGVSIQKWQSTNEWISIISMSMIYVCCSHSSQYVALLRISWEWMVLLLLL